MLYHVSGAWFKYRYTYKYKVELELMFIVTTWEVHLYGYHWYPKRLSNTDYNTQYSVNRVLENGSPRKVVFQVIVCDTKGRSQDIGAKLVTNTT